jgi:hypothetical protein
MSVGVMEDYKLRDLLASKHWVGRQGMSFFCFFKDTHVLGQYLYFCMNKERTKRKLERL